ncbi:hypothetical protein [Paenibacillus sp. YAF4_2]|uniref:hypothetical protein n=1 Tax=Paenibacillus sp. YAF4_2 TaxID=3233085 RepID=UPI003F98FDD2
MQLDLLFPVFLKETIHSTTVFAFGDWDLQLSGEKLFCLIVSENGLFVALFSLVCSRYCAVWPNVYILGLKTFVSRLAHKKVEPKGPTFYIY